ncbi:MAG: hypothetical protein K2X64_05480 [Rhodocyclaceae bacterium]|nr:hypothetical protein [Rhodocyclaceae bacterium]
MRLPCLFLLGLLIAAPASAQSFGGFLRGLSDTLSGGSARPAPTQSNNATATIGVRGMDEEDKSGTSMQSNDSSVLKSLDTWSATKIEAEMAASKRGLKANPSVKLSDATNAGVPK